MNKDASVIFTALILLLGSAMAVSTVDRVEIHSPVAEVVDGAVYTWGPQEFAGFYYDIDDNLGKESITITITGDSLEEPNGVIYETVAEQKYFEFEEWGKFWTIAFLAEEYFAAYVEDAPETAYLFDDSTYTNLMVDEQLCKVLYDDDQERTFAIDTPLKLEEGYELEIQAIDLDGDKVYVQLTKDGQAVESVVVEPTRRGATIADKTYTYKMNIGETVDIVGIAVHFKNAFHGVGQDMVTVDGIWQISETYTDIEEDTEYDKMTIQTVDADTKTIMMGNEDNKITLNENKDTLLMENVRIITADQNATDEDPLRFYISKVITEPGMYEIRGRVAEVVDGMTYTWKPQEFAGFYYDIDENLGTEEITITITYDALEEPDGVVYTTSGQITNFEFGEWGKYWTIGFLAEEYFAAYSEGRLADESTISNLMRDEQLCRVLIDDDGERSVTNGTHLMLGDGYEIVIPFIDAEENIVIVQLMKRGRFVDFAVVKPSEGATVEDGTYYYQKKLGKSGEIVVLAVHFKNVFRGAETDIATVDGIWQISDMPIYVSQGTKYYRMTIQTVNADEFMITMNNENETINLDSNRDEVLLGKIGIRTADQEVISAEKPLRFYIYNDEYLPIGSPWINLVPYKLAEGGSITREIEPITRESVNSPISANMRNGTVVYLDDDKSSGYIEGDDEEYYYFDEDSLREGISVEEGDRVIFEAISSEIGLEARDVRKIRQYRN